MNYDRLGIFISVISLAILLSCTIADTSTADISTALTLIYSGEEGGQLGLHGCGTEQVGGLSRRQTVIHSLREQYASPLNLHTGTLTNPTDSNNELIYQIALEALGTMNYDAVCLGPQDLYLPVDVLSALYANHPNLSVVCTNLSGADPNSLSFAPYTIQKTAMQLRVAVIGLISKSHQIELSAYNPDITLTDPAERLKTLGGEITGNSDVVVGVFHGTEAEARQLAEQFPWLSVLILAQNESSELSKDTPLVVGTTTIVINPAKGEAVGVLEVGLNTDQQVISRRNHRVAVSEGIVPDPDLETLLTLYHSLSEGDEFGG